MLSKNIKVQLRQLEQDKKKRLMMKTQESLPDTSKATDSNVASGFRKKRKPQIEHETGDDEYASDRYSDSSGMRSRPAK